MAEVSGVMMELETPKKSLQAEPSTPRRSERKRALFPTLSPQTSDLGHMSPLGSSPDRYSSAPASPDSATFSPPRKSVGPVSPFGRKASATTYPHRSSPRKQFSLLLGKALRESNVLNKISPIASKKKVGTQQQSLKSSGNLSEIVPNDQLEQTLISVMDDSDCPDSPQSEHTPGSKDLIRTTSDVTSTRPLTPSKRRSIPASGSGSTTSSSPQSVDQKRRFSLQGSRSAGAELPRARTSLFSSTSHSTKRPRDDGIYLTGRNSKRRRTFGEINAGVSTGIRRPPKVKPKSNTVKKSTKVKSVWDVGPKSAVKRKSLSPIKLPKMSLLAKPVKKSDEEISSLSASASLQVRSKRARAKDEENLSASEEENMDVESPAPDPNKRFLKHSKPRSATITISKNIRIRVHKGKFILDKPAPVAPVKRRKLYNQQKQIEEIRAFEDNEEDVADGTRGEVQNILQKLEDDKTITPESDSLENGQSESEVETQCSEDKSTDPPQNAANHQAAPTAPKSPEKYPDLPSENLLSPLSQLATSTSTLSIDVGGDTTVNLTEAQVKALTAVPDIIMEEDDLPLCEPLPEEEKASSESNELKENENSISFDSDMTPVKYFPIFTSNFSHQKLPVSPVHAKRKRSLLGSIGNDQYQLDAGQKRFGATECGTCSLIYQMGEPDDELAHQEFHNAVKDLKFLGWKNEHVVGEHGLDRIIVIRPGDPKAWWSKALEVLHVADRELGFAEGVKCDPDHSMVYLYISDKSVKGCLLALPVKNANKMLETKVEAEGIDCCTAEEYPVKCGVSRIWVHRPFRRGNVATRLMDCMRKNFMFGHVLSVEEIAFSSPTVAGKIFAEHYTGCKDFFVFTQV